MVTRTGPQLLPQYRDVTVELVEKRRQHWYRVSGFDDLLPSVTTCLKIIDKSGPLVGWAKNVTLEKVRAELLDYAAGPFPDRDDYRTWVDGVLVQAKARPDQVRDEAADAGTTAHNLIADILEGGNPSIPEVLAPAVQGAMEFLSDYTLTAEVTEEPVWHPVCEYAGTVDCIARDPDGRLVIVDWKRAKGIYPEYAYQVGAYAQAVMEITGEQVAAAYVVRLPRSRDESMRYECKQVQNIDSAFRTYTMAQSLWQSVNDKDLNPVWTRE